VFNFIWIYATISYREIELWLSHTVKLNDDWISHTVKLNDDYLIPWNWIMTIPHPEIEWWLNISYREIEWWLSHTVKLNYDYPIPWNWMMSEYLIPWNWMMIISYREIEWWLNISYREIEWWLSHTVKLNDDLSLFVLLQSNNVNIEDILQPRVSFYFLSVSCNSQIFVNYTKVSHKISLGNV
jgi:hypothetical protein